MPIKSDYQDILNIALIPAFDSDLERIASLSKRLNQPKSNYHLRLADERQTKGSSLPHCTLMHFRLYADKTKKEQLFKRIAPLFGLSLNLNISGLKTIKAPAFIKEDLLKFISSKEENHVLWLEVEKTAELLALQQTVVAAIANDELLITPQQKDYSPHFTLWVNDSPKKVISEREPSLWRNQQLACRVILGTTGPIGQVETLYRI